MNEPNSLCDKRAKAINKLNGVNEHIIYKYPDGKSVK